MTARVSLRVALAPPLRAAWAPILVFLLHAFISRVLNAYLLFPPLDIPMHFFGGVAIAFFFSACFQAVPLQVLGSPHRAWLGATLIFALTATASLFWEFAEFVSDHFFGTHAQLGLEDTLLDMALGVSGGLTYLAMAARTGRLTRDAVPRRQTSEPG